MQATPKILKIFMVVLVASLVLSACGGGGTSGSTAFNLPSIPLKINDDYSASILGFNLGPVIPADQIQQLQAANVQKFEARIGYNGIHLYANGEDLPAIKWDQASMEAVQDIIRNLPDETLQGVDGAQIADNLPTLRQIGLGFALKVPPAEGASPVDSPRWTGETSFTEETPESTTLGPLAFGGLAFDDSGNAFLEGVNLSDLGDAMGAQMPFPLDTGIMNIIKSIGAEKLGIKTQPNGVDLSLNDTPLPSLEYDSAALDRLLAIAGPLLPDPGLAETLNTVLPKLPGADIDLAVSFTGEQAAQTSIGAIPLEVQEGGKLAAFGIPVGAELPADLMEQLQAAGVGRLDVNVTDNSLRLAANGERLPIVNWNPDALGPLAEMANLPPEALENGLSIVENMTSESPLGMQLAMPGADTASMPEEVDYTMVTPDLGEMAPPTIHLNATYVGNELESINDLSASDLDELGVALPPLPPNVAEMLAEMNADELNIVTSPNQLDIMVNGETLLSLSYDEASLARMLSLAAPFLEGSPMENPEVAQLVQEQILPLLPGADVNITISLQ